MDIKQGYVFLIAAERTRGRRVWTGAPAGILRWCGKNMQRHKKWEITYEKDPKRE